MKDGTREWDSVGKRERERKTLKKRDCLLEKDSEHWERVRPKRDRETDIYTHIYIYIYIYRCKRDNVHKCKSQNTARK